VVVGQRFAGRRAIPIAIAFVLGLGALLLGVMFELPGGRDVHVGTLSALMMGAAIVIPWGVWPQLVVAAMLALADGFVPTESMGVAHSVDLVMSLADCVALSAVAVVLRPPAPPGVPRARRARRMTAQREILLDASRQLNGSLDLEETVATITRVGRAIIGADTVALISSTRAASSYGRRRCPASCRKSTARCCTSRCRWRAAAAPGRAQPPRVRHDAGPKLRR
jgi:hypothetical protein